MSANIYNTSARSTQAFDTPNAIANYCGRAEKSGSQWKANCPICGRHSLSITYGHKFSVLIRCWHCEAVGLNNGYSEQRTLFIKEGLLDANDYDARKFNHKQFEEYVSKRRAEAATIWASPFLRPVTLDSFPGKYLQSRGLGSFIGHPALRRGPLWPVLIARVWHVQHGISAVQYTSAEVSLDGSIAPTGKADHRRTCGVLRGAAVWIGAPKPDEEFVVGEGLETVLSAMLLLDSSCGAAVLGPNLKSLVLPRSAQRLHIAADNDETGRGAAQCAAKLWRSQGLRVRVSMPDSEGQDFNDVLKGRRV